MALHATDAKDLELAHAFARAYREIDDESMRALLAPTSRVRMLMPRGFFEHEGPDNLLAHLRDFSTKWVFESVDHCDVELLGQNMMQTGRLVLVGQRLRLRSANGSQTGTMVMKHLLAIKDNRIAVLDELCTGLMPSERTS